MIKKPPVMSLREYMGALIFYYNITVEEAEKIAREQYKKQWGVYPEEHSNDTFKWGTATPPIEE